MTIFLSKVFRAAITLILLAFITGCSPGKNLNGLPTPTPTPGAPGNAFVYTADAGGNTISGFANDSTGALTPVPGSPFISAGTPFGLAATSDNRFLYVSSFQNNVVTGFSVSTTNGSLTPLSCPLPAATGVQPLKIDINPAGTFLYTANQGGGAGNGSISVFSIDPASGCLTSVSVATTDNVARDLTIERNGNFLYAVTGGGGINAFSIAADGTLTRLVTSGFDSATGTMVAVKASPVADVLLATDAGNANLLRTFLIDPATGALAPVQAAASGTSPSAIAFNAVTSPATPEIYIANTGSNNITTDVTDSSGAIGAALNFVPDSTGPVDLAVDPSGRFLYVANNGSSDVAAFTANIDGSNFNSAFIAAAATGSGPESIVVVGHP